MTKLVAELAAIRQAKRKPKRKSEEHDFQRCLFQLLDLILPHTAVLTSIDHAGDISAWAGAMRAARGVLPGIPDTLITHQPDLRVRLQTCVWLETKARTGRLSIEQQKWRDILLAAGHYWGAPRTIEEALATIRESGIPLRPVRL